MDFETKRQKVLAYIKGLKTMPVVIAKEPAPEPVAVIDGVKYFHKKEINFEDFLSRLTPEKEGTCDIDLLTREIIPDVEELGTAHIRFVDESPDAYVAFEHDPLGNYEHELSKYDSTTGDFRAQFISRAFAIVNVLEEVDNDSILLPICSAFYAHISEDGKTFISYYNLKDDGAPTETIMVPVYDQNGVDPEKIEALKTVAAGGKVGEELLDELVDFIDNPPEPPVPPGPVIDDTKFMLF